MSSMAAKKISLKPSRREKQSEATLLQILKAVDELFYLEGARSVGVEAVAKRAGVFKMTIYRHFDSKEALLLAYLTRMEQIFWEYFETSINKHPNDPRAQLLQFFIDLEARSHLKSFRGCPFVNIAAEFSDPSHPARKAVAQNKKSLLKRIQSIAKAAGAKNSKRLASGLTLLIEGAYAASQTFAAEDQILTALASVAEKLLDAELY